jgi:hypothetical protein
MIQLARHVVGYLDAKMDFAAATGYRKLMRILASLCWMMIFIVIAMIAVLCLTAALGMAVGAWLNSRALGLLCMGIMYVGILSGLLKTRRSIIKYFFNLLDSAIEKEQEPDALPSPSNELLQEAGA